VTTTTPPVPDVPARGEVDLAPGTMIAITWLAAVVATSITLWVLVALIGSGT
jgi:hypothetical protein